MDVHSSRRVTIVDDDELFLSSARRILERDGIRVTAFVDSRQAIIRLCEGLGTDLLILDLTMPNFDGIEFMTNLANVDFKSPLLLVSGWWPETLELATALGRGIGLDIVGAYEKPFDIGQVRTHFGTRRVS